jgi:hypothetical protein
LTHKFYTMKNTVLICSDQKKKNNISQEVNTIKTILTDIKSAYGALGLAPELTVSDITAMFNNPLEALYDKLTYGKTIAFDGLEIEKSKAMEFIKKPAGFNEFISFIEEKKRNLEHLKGMQDLRNTGLEDYEFVKGVPKLKPDSESALNQSCEYWATTQRQIDEHTELQKIADALNAIRILSGDDKAFNPNAYLEKSLLVNSWDKTVNVNHRFIVNLK